METGFPSLLDDCRAPLLQVGQHTLDLLQRGPQVFRNLRRQHIRIRQIRRIFERMVLTERGAEGRPGLVVEILSPSSGRIDKVKKPARYADFGVPEYWVVDPDAKAVLVWQFDYGPTAVPRMKTIPACQGAIRWFAAEFPLA